MSNLIRSEHAARLPAAEPPLLEREDAASAWQHLLGTCHEIGGVLTIEGGPGIGKTRILEQAASVAAAAGMRVLHASGGELEQDHPFGVVTSVFHALVRDHDGAWLDGHASPAATLLRTHGTPKRPRPRVDEPAMLHALFWLLANIADEAPVALIVDDLHWADPESRAWLAYAGRRLRDLPVALLIATRPTDDPRVAQLAAAGDRIHPAALTPAAARDLVAQWGWPDDSIDPVFADACHGATGGNPFLLRELVHELRAGGVEPVAAAVDGVGRATPERVVAWIDRRLGSTSDHARRIAAAASVAPVGSGLPLIARIADVDPTAAASMLGDLVGAGILRDDPWNIEFVHPIVRAATLERLGITDRALLHRRSADRLAEAGAADEVVANQLLSTPPMGDERTVGRLRSGARRLLERGAPEPAARMLVRAVDEDAELDDADHVALLRELGEAMARSGSPDVDRWFEATIELEPNAELRARDAASLGRARFAQARFGAALDAFDRGRRELQSAGIGGEPALELAAGWSAAVVFTPAIAKPEVLAEVEQLVHDTTAVGSLAHQVALGHMAGLEMLMTGRPEASARMASRAWGAGSLLHGAGTDEPALWAVTAAAFGLGDLDLVFEVTDAVSDAAVANGSAIAASTASCVRSHALLQKGHVADALAEAESALAVGHSLGEPRYWEMFLPAALDIAAQAHVCRGDFDRARDVLALPPDQEERWSGVLVYLPLLEARGMLALAERRWADALDLFHRHSHHSHAILGRDINPAYSGGWRCGAAEALAQLDRHGEALELADAELEVVRSWGQPRAIGRALRARAQALNRNGTELMDEAAAMFAAHGFELDRAQALHDAGVVLRTAGRRSDAHDRQRVALDIADRIGATLLVERAHDELRVLGARPRRHRSTGSRALTPTERRVARLAAAGHTNREIAERLFVTMHAIRFHLRNTYAKLEVTDRSDLADALNDGGNAGSES